MCGMECFMVQLNSKAIKNIPYATERKHSHFHRGRLLNVREHVNDIIICMYTYLLIDSV